MCVENGDLLVFLRDNFPCNFFPFLTSPLPLMFGESSVMVLAAVALCAEVSEAKVPFCL